MFISKKRWQSLEKRIADLEVRVQSQQKHSDVIATIDGNPVLKSQEKERLIASSSLV